MTPEQMEEAKKRPGANLPFIYSFVAELIMAWVLAGLIGHLGPPTLRNGVISGGVLLARLRDHHAGRQLQLRNAQLAADR